MKKAIILIVPLVILCVVVIVLATRVPSGGDSGETSEFSYSWQGNSSSNKVNNFVFETLSETTCGMKSVGKLTSYEIYVPETYDGKTVVEIMDNCFEDSIVTKIVLPETIKKIGKSAFSKCDRLTQINIPDSVEDVSTDAFYGCSSITGTKSLGALYLGSANYPCKIVVKGIPDYPRVTLQKQTQYICDNAFAAYTNLIEISLPQNLKAIGVDAFYGCKQLKAITIPSGIKEIKRNAFYECVLLTNVYLPNDLTAIGDYAFSGCAALKTINIPSNLSTIGKGAFYGCAALESVEFKATDNWFVYETDEYISGQKVDVSVPSNMKQALVELYDDYYWKR